MPTTTRGYRYPAGSAAPNVPLDLANLAADVDADVTAVAAMTWTAFTPVWTATGTNPVLGNGDLSSRYQQTGKLITYSGRLSTGSTTTYGTGVWLISLPVTAKVTTPFQLGYPGSAYLLDGSTPANRQGGACLLSSTTQLNFVGGMGGGVVGPTVPFTWALADALHWTITYEAA